MWITRPAAAALLVMMTGLPAMAQDIEIATLGRAPIMGSSRDSAELKRNFNNPANQVVVHRAALKLGLTENEWTKFKGQVEIDNASWQPIPRHLDKMTWAAGGVVHVLAGVHIPSGQWGYRVLVPRDNGTGQYIVYLPAKCGNISYVLENMPPPRPVAAKYPTPHALVASAQNFPAPQQSLVAPTVVSGSTPAVSPVIPVIPHHFNLYPLAALLPFLIHGSSNPPGSNPGTISGPPPCP